MPESWASSLRFFGPHLANLNLPLFKLIVGTLLLLFVLRWLRKAILRAGGVLALHDETKACARETAALQEGTRGTGFDFGAAAAAVNGVFIEGVEVIFSVLAVGAAGGTSKLAAAVAGAVAAAVIVILARRPLARVP